MGPAGETAARAPNGNPSTVGINICADVWEPEAPKRALAAGAMLFVLNASPFHIDKLRSRHEVVRERTAETGMPVVFAIWSAARMNSYSMVHHS